jgi:hypothetical protein
MCFAVLIADSSLSLPSSKVLMLAEETSALLLPARMLALAKLGGENA